MKRTICSLAAIASLVLVGLQPAFSTVYSYTDSTTFASAVTGATSHNFDGFASVVDSSVPGSGLFFGSPTAAGVTFASNNIPFVIDTSYNPIYGVPFFSGQGNADNSPANIVSVSLSGYNAIGFFYGSYITQNEPYSATLNTGDVFNFATPSAAGTLNFIGFVSNAGPITNINLTSLAGLNNPDQSQGYGYAFDITKFVLADANTPVPEPSTIFLLGIGLTGVGLLRRRAKK